MSVLNWIEVNSKGLINLGSITHKEPSKIKGTQFARERTNGFSINNIRGQWVPIVHDSIWKEVELPICTTDWFNYFLILARVTDEIGANENNLVTSRSHRPLTILKHIF